jgi:hypothetical protein
MRSYRYVGSQRISNRIRPASSGFPIRTPDDVRVWVKNSMQHLSDGEVIATFVVDLTGVLLIADRRSEHVACAGGLPVLSAGEVTFNIGHAVEVTAVSNQSTGYCPEPESWPSVAESLSKAGMIAPDGFSMSCEFRRCIRCGNLNLVKNRVFECGVCDAELPAAYNVQEQELTISEPRGEGV